MPASAEVPAVRKMPVRWIVLGAAVEAVTGLVLIIVPSLFGRLIFGAELSEPGQALGRLAGIALLAFGLACWPASAAANQAAPPGVRALLVYNLLAAIYLCYLGIAGKLVGLLLWPAAVLHAILTVLVGRAWRGAEREAR